MEPERVKGLKILSMAMAGTLIFGAPIFRSGGRTGLSFWQWVVNHSIFGPPVEYVPEEDYMAELAGIKPEVLKGKPSAEEIQSLMKYYQLSEPSARALVANQSVLETSRDGQLRLYDDLLARVRYDGKYHPIKSLVNPDEPEVREVARVLVQAPDFIEAVQEFVNTFTVYEREQGDYWATPAEVLSARAGDCDDLAILTTSLLRNYIPADQVFVAFGLWNQGKLGGHAWVVTDSGNYEDRVVEATAGPDKPLRGKYTLQGIFNDKYAFSTDIGLREFDLQPVEKVLV